MSENVRWRVLRTMERTGLIGPYYWMVQRRVARQSYEPFDDGRPMPPRDLAMAVAGTAGQRWFSQQGREDADRLLDLARAHGVGVGVGGPVDVLDFGCGCGRIARWVAPEVVAAGGVFYGSDLNRRLIAWCSKHLPGRYLPNRLQPPLDLPTGSVDLVYALSVLTHLTEVTTVGWLAEIRRILRPGGIALLTFLDEQYAERWGPADVLPELRARGFTVLNNALEGSNYMSAWITPAYFTRLAEPAFEVLEFVPSGTDMPKQAVAVLRALP